MTDHYFTGEPSSEYIENFIEKEIHGRKFGFHTSSGVFSRNTVDFGTMLLIETVTGDIPAAATEILDMGCGYGPIGISIAAFNGMRRVKMADINERAIELSDKNIKHNRISNAVAVKSDGFGNITGNFDVIITNPPIRAGKKTVYSIFAGARDHLSKDGVFYCVIQKKQGAESAQKELQRIFGNCETINRKSGYRIFKSTMK
ncbi:MAG: class I SAM-dependent methyltransferase [Clostridia bacterium]|nr:class I SAM-dependent methyltransferase [Clostridia bacterium]